MERAPGRDTRPAYSSERRTWYGYGTLTRAEKPPMGQYLHDVAYLFADISFLSLPVLMLVFLHPDVSLFGVKTTGLVAWVTMAVVGAAIRGGWISPLATDVLGWLSLAPTLIVLRILYYNVVLGVVIFGATALANTLDIPSLSLPFAIGGSTLAVMLFPRIGESVYRRLSSE